MSNLTLKNFGQSGNSVKQDKLNNFLESMGVEELDDAASAAVNGGSGSTTLLPDANDIQKLVDGYLTYITDPTSYTITIDPTSGEPTSGDKIIPWHSHPATPNAGNTFHA